MYDCKLESSLRRDNLVGEFSSEDDNDPIYEFVVESEEKVDSEADLEDLVVEDNAIFQILRRRLMKLILVMRSIGQQEIE